MLKELLIATETKQYSKELRNTIDKAQEAFKNAGISTQGICIPFKEERAILTASQIVGQEAWNLETEIYNTSILANCGANITTGFISNVQVPTVSKLQSTWEGETASAKDGNPTIVSQTVKPKRVTTTLEVSRQFYMQTTNVEKLLCRMLAQAINQKIEETIFSATEIENAVAPLLTEASATTVISDYSDLCDFEDTAADTLKPTYILSKSAKNKLRNLVKANGNNVMEDGKIDGTNVVTSSSVADSYLVFGDFSKLNLIFWGNGVDITIDPVTLAKDGKIRITVNAYVDYFITNKNAIVIAKV